MKKLLKRAVLAILGLLALLLIVAAVLPRTFVLEREVVIDRPRDEVFSYVRLMENQKHYSVWAQLDPQVETQIQGIDGQVGAIYSWKSQNQNVGTGEQEIKAIREGEQIDYELRMKEPFASTDPLKSTLEAVSDKQTKLRSTFSGTLRYPSNLLCSIVCAKVGDDMQRTLQQLKTAIEK